MAWAVIFHEAFDDEFGELPRDVQTALAAKTRLLEAFGPTLSRPHVDTLKGSKHANMKELRFDAADGVWRVAFAFDAVREAVVLCAGDKSGLSERKFYRDLIGKADRRFTEHLAGQKQRLAGQNKEDGDG